MVTNNEIKAIRNLLEKNNLILAEQLIDRTLKENYDNYYLNYYKALCLSLKNQYEESIKFYQKAYLKNKKDVNLIVNYASALNYIGKNIEALKLFENVSQNNNIFQIFYNKGNIYLDLKEYHNAIIEFQKALSINSSLYEAYNNIGKCYHELKIYDEAIVNYNAALNINSYEPEILINKGISCLEIFAIKEAYDCFNEALKYNPNSFRSYTYIGCALSHSSHLYDLQKALSIFEKSIEINPNFQQSWIGMGNALLKLGRPNCALDCINRAIELGPESPVAFSNKGLALHALLKFDEALLAYQTAISIDPAFAEAYLNRSFTELLMCNFKDGWENFEYRWRVNGLEKYRYSNIQELSNIGNILDKTILVWSEQGVGDVIQFSRYVYQLLDMKVNIIFEIPKDLIGIFNDHKNLKIITNESQLDKVDYQIPLLSIPRVFQTNLLNIPCLPTKIKIDKKKSDFFKSKMDPIRKKAGLVCSGHVNHKNDLNRSISLKHFKSLLEKNLAFYLTQKEIRLDDYDFLSRSSIFNMAPFINDYSDTVSIINNLDLVITVDTSVAHLAGSMHKEVYLLLSYCPDWRWQIIRNDSPWYPTMKIIRQKEIGNWPDVIKELINILKL